MKNTANQTDTAQTPDTADRVSCDDRLFTQAEKSIIYNMACAEIERLIECRRSYHGSKASDATIQRFNDAIVEVQALRAKCIDKPPLELY